MKKTTLREILISYERKRDNADRSLKQRKNDVYKQIPQIKEIEEEISKVGLEMMRLVLKNPANKEQLCLQSKEKINELKTKKEDLLNKYNVPKGYLEIQYECPLCNDRGFLPNGKKCNCLKQAIINESYKMSNLCRMLEKQNQFTYDDSIFSEELDPKNGISPRQNMQLILSDCDEFIYDFYKDDDKNLLFYGDTGLGKTFMSNYIAKALLDKGHVVIYQTAFKMFEIIEEYKFRNSDKHLSRDDYENLFECDLLIIDDLGTELTNAFTISELFIILNTRLLNGKKTIISTNLSPAQLGELYSQRIFSRIFDKFKMIKFIGADLRWQNKRSSIQK
ncbi:MAG: ATP-binding protein [Terrisporobacter sp.]|uniref:ATP-binding protein n=1 Tax=Terrisporobacter sp. TaxID=1965305 RepID=UPI002FC62A13